MTAHRAGAVGRPLTALSLAAVAMAPTTPWLLGEHLLSGYSIGVFLLAVALGVPAVLTLAVSAAVLAVGLRDAPLLSLPGSLLFALGLPLGLTVDRLLATFGLVAGSPLFAPAIVYAPFGLAWVLLGARLLAPRPAHGDVDSAG